MLQKIGGHYGQKIKWYGTQTDRRISWACYGDTYQEIYDHLIRAGVIDQIEGDPIDIARLAKVGLTLGDFEKKYEEELDENDFYTVFDDIAKVPEIADEEIKEVILKERGNAYYQEFSLWSEEEQDYIQD